MDQNLGKQMDYSSMNNEEQSFAIDTSEEILRKLRDTSELDEEYLEFAKSQDSLNDYLLSIQNVLMVSNLGQAIRTAIDPVSFGHSGTEPFAQDFQMSSNISNVFTESYNGNSPYNPNQNIHAPNYNQNIPMDDNLQFDENGAWLNQQHESNIRERSISANVPSEEPKETQKIIRLKKDVSNPIGQKRHKCEICMRKFTSKSNLVRHKRIHTNYKPFICNTCHRTFYRKSNLNNHVRLIHFREKPFSCPTCSETFATKSQLTRHSWTHIR